MVDMCTLWGHETVFIDIGVSYGKEYLGKCIAWAFALFGGMRHGPVRRVFACTNANEIELLRNEGRKRKRMLGRKGRDLFPIYIAQSTHLPMEVPISSSLKHLLIFSLHEIYRLRCVCFADECCRSSQSTDADNRPPETDDWEWGLPTSPIATYWYQRISLRLWGSPSDGSD